MNNSYDIYHYNPNTKEVLILGTEGGHNFHYWAKSFCVMDIHSHDDEDDTITQYVIVAYVETGARSIATFDTLKEANKALNVLTNKVTDLFDTPSLA